MDVGAAGFGARTFGARGENAWRSSAQHGNCRAGARLGVAIVAIASLVEFGSDAGEGYRGRAISTRRAGPFGNQRYHLATNASRDTDTYRHVSRLEHTIRGHFPTATPANHAMAVLIDMI